MVLEIVAICLLAVLVVLVCLLIFFTLRKKNNKDVINPQDIQKSVNESMVGFNSLIQTMFEQNSKYQQEKIDSLISQVNLTIASLDKSVNSLTLGMSSLQEQNNKKLDEMRNVVDEKLQKTLDTRITQSFETVNKYLQDVYQALGEMKKLTSDVNQLQNVLGNVKTTGILGEYQLGAILSEILAPNQYVTNYVTKPNSRLPVEYAIKMPGKDDNDVYLPIDSKFPLISYQAVLNAQESGNKEEILNAKKVLHNNLMSFAKDIATKYIEVPYTTDFAVMFLPTEGLYAEAVKMNLIEEMNAKYKISLAGPSTLAAFLNALQMGFKTLTIQKRSSEVWNILSKVKNEFATFENVLNDTQEKLKKAQDGLDQLVGVRTRQINKALNQVHSLENNDSEPKED